MWIQTYLKITGAIMIVTLPLVAYDFNQIPWLGILANLLVIPFAGFVLVPFGLGSALWLLISWVRLLAGGFNQPSSGRLAGGHGRCLGQGSRGGMAHSLTGAAWNGHLLPIAVHCLALESVFDFGWERSEASCFFCAGGRGRRAPGSDGDTLRITFLDVGQGDACVIELPDNRTVLIDGGASYDTLDMGRAVVGPFLWDQGITRLDHVIGTHPQLDHVGGLAWTVRKFQVGHYWGNGLSRDEPFYQRLRAGLDAQGVHEEIAESGQMIIDSGPCRLRILNPPAPDQVARPLSVNRSFRNSAQ